ncbi:Serine/threonine-protein kinase mTOR [Clonorchis sinensis]|uniref:non-specific serine/threonine protein kinase n=1 Tax=Clonorchis sinensis TaxID=79923 RepID=A0A8T1MPK4_CLOSI|nr:Serine/threonine-protein kinase mTOR [Clonorchis sinensis]
MNVTLPAIVGRLVEGLKSPYDDERLRAVQELHRIVDRELKEVSIQSYGLCLNLLCPELLSMYINGEIYEKKGAVAAMGCLAEIDFLSVQAHCGRFASEILNRSSATDIQLTAMEAHLMGQFCLVFPYEFIERLIKCACESLISENQDAKKQFSILFLRELVLNTPTSFYQQFGLFIPAILASFRDKNATTRELASLTLRAALSLAASREQALHLSLGAAGAAQPGGLSHGLPNTHSSSLRHASTDESSANAGGSCVSSVAWYRSCLSEALRRFGENPSNHPSESSQYHSAQAKKLCRDDWVHGSMLLLSELLASVLPDHEQLLAQLDEMAGVPLMEFLPLGSNESALAARTVLLARASFFTSPSLFVTSIPLVHSPVLSSASRFAPSIGSGALTQFERERTSQSNPVSWLCQRVLVENIEEIFSTVTTWLKLRTQQRVVLLLKLIPRLFALKSSHFNLRDRQQPIVDWLFHYLNKEREKPMALLCLALLGYHIGQDMCSSGWLTQLFTLVRSYLPSPRDASTKKRSIPLETAAILTVGILVKSVGNAIQEPVQQMLDSLFASGLSQPLVATCKLVAVHIPKLSKEVENQILNDISRVLMHNSGSTLGQPHSSMFNSVSSVSLVPLPNVTTLLNSLVSSHNTPATVSGVTAGLAALATQLSGPGSSSTSAVVPIGATSSGSAGITGGFGSGGSSVSRMMLYATGKLRPSACGISCTSSSIADLSHVAFPGSCSPGGEMSSEVAVVALALRTIGTFNFSGRPLAPFVRHISDNFISITTCDVKEVRLEAVKTCARLMLPWLKAVDPNHWFARPAMNTVADILGKLLTVGISDPDPDVRRCVFESVDPGFDPHLTQADHLSSLFLALRDEVFEIRCLVMQRLGRLSDLNPACVQPNLRKVLLYTLNDLAHSGSTKNKEQSALLLACLITSAPRFFTPYADPVLQILVPRIRQALPITLRESIENATNQGDAGCKMDAYNGRTNMKTMRDPVTGDQPTLLADPPAILRPPPGSRAPNGAGDATTSNKRFGNVNMAQATDQVQDSPGHPTNLTSILTRIPQTSVHLGVTISSLSSDISNQWTEPTSVVIALFTTLGRLSGVAPAAVRAYMDEFIPILCCMMQDQSCFARRAIAVWTLGTLVSNTGYVVTPYERHPQLLPILLDMLKREESKEIRQEVLRALGVVGALDPFKFRLITGQVDTFGDTGIAVSLHEADEKKDVDIAQPELVVSLSWESRDVFFSVCALSALMHMLRDPALRSQYSNIVKTIVYVLKLLGTRSVYYLRQLMPDYFNCLRNTRDVGLAEFLIRQLGSIMNVVRLHTKEFATEVVDLLLSHWWVAPNVQNACIQLLSPMASVLGAEFRPHLTRLIPVILRTLHHEPNEANLILLLEILPEFGYTLEDHAHILVPAISSLIDVTGETNLLMLLNSTADASNKTSTAASVPKLDSALPNRSEGNLFEATFDIQSLDFVDGQQQHQKSSEGMALTQFAKMSVPTATTTVMSLAASTMSAPGFVGGLQLRVACLECLARLTDRMDLDDFSCQIVHPICRLLLTLEGYHQQLQYLNQHPHHLPSSAPSSTMKTAVSHGIQLCSNAINALHPAAVDVLTGLLLRMGQKFKLLLPLVRKMLDTLHLRPTRFYTVLGRVEKGAYLPMTSDQYLTGITSLATQTRAQRTVQREPDASAVIKVLDTKGANLERAWRSSTLISREDWDQWLMTLTTALLRESPNPAIRACSNLIAINNTIGRTLFNAAFVSCWPELTAPQQDALISKLEEVLLSSDQSPEVSQAILNLEEFMAHVDKYSSTSTRVPLPLSLHLLADRAMKNRAYAKALYYKEQEFLEEVKKLSSPSQETLSCLLTIYSKLQLDEAATGVLIYATRQPNDKLVNEEAWRERLQDWKCALNLYENKLKDERIKDKTPHMLGRMRCLRALGQWVPLKTMVSKNWDLVDESVRRQMAPMACSAAWAADEWDQVERYASALPTDQNFYGAFYRSVLDIHSGRFDRACHYIAKARDVLDADLTTMTGESYDRAYADLVGTQLLSEAEEVIQYKLVPERRSVLREAWCARLLGCQSVVEDWGQVLQLRSLVLKPQDDLKTWLRFAGLCRRSGRFTLARELLQNLLSHDPAHSPQTEPIPNADPATVFAYTKLLWSTGAHEEAVTRLYVLITRVLEPMLSSEAVTLSNPRSFASVLDANEVLDSFDPKTTAAQAVLERQELRALMAKCCLRLGSWYSELYARCPPGTYSSDGSASTVSQSYSPGTGGLQASVATATKLSRSQTSTIRGPETPSAQPLRAARSGIQISESDQARKTPGNTATGSTVMDGGGVSVPQTWDEHQGFVILCYDVATNHAPGNRAAWHSWAMANYAVFQHLDTLKARIERAEMDLNKAGSTSPGSHSLSKPTSPAVTSVGNLSPSSQGIVDLWHAKKKLQFCMELHAAPSVRGFVNSISLSPSANLQDSLRLIDLLFKFGHLVEIREVIREGLAKIRLSNWLLVVQQLLARIDTPREYVASIIVDMLIAVGKSYPQSLVYSLVLAFKSGGSDRRRYNANRILYSMEEHSPRLVSEAFLLNEELIRLSITWVEMWSEALEDASRVYFGEKDIMKMFRILYPLHLMMDRGHETAHESAFLQEHGNDLRNCRFCCETYERNSSKIVLQQAWEGYYTLYRQFTKQMNNMPTLELVVASPRLHEYRKDWELAVPGSYEPNRPLVRIAGIKNCLTLMTSKQHPRKLTVLGSDGHQYVFLLKGHEDTRQDERVMQFFGLVNTLLMNNSETLRRNLTIQRMSVIPLSTNTGLIGWVPNSDTLHSLIRDYREKTQTILNKENREMIRLARDFDRLNVIQKTEIFEAGLRDSSGRDLANILWLKSHSSEAWFERRTNFVRSMATMSMVGYILGLGDRHPSNIMLSRETGKVVHIDFGDCFEVAMMREKFPEKVPFRLTRMIIAAMEVIGIDGVYRQTCEMVMSLMRNDRESLLAVLEAFIHDPLLQWVILENRKDFTQMDNKLDDGASMAGTIGGQPTTNEVMAPGQPMMNGGANMMGANQQQKGHPKQPEHPYRQHQTTTARRPADRTGGLVPPNAQHHGYEYQAYHQQQNHLPHPPTRRSTSPRRVFTNPNHPDSVSLRDPHRINHWRHHLCNGPWFGCYETARRLRKQTEAGQVVERQGLQGFIFSAKPLNEEDAYNETEASPITLENAKARAVVDKIRQKLNGTEREQPMNVPNQVDYLIREATSNQNLCQMYIGCSVIHLLETNPDFTLQVSGGHDKMVRDVCSAMVAPSPRAEFSLLERCQLSPFLFRYAALVFTWLQHLGNRNTPEDVRPQNVSTPMVLLFLY